MPTSSRLITSSPKKRQKHRIQRDLRKPIYRRIVALPTVAKGQLPRNFDSPRASGSGHSSEVDFFTYAMVSLYTISYEDFIAFQRNTFDGKINSIDPKELLNFYLENACNPDSPNKMYRYKNNEANTVTILNQYPELREVIDLAFQVSEGGPNGEAAFQRLQEIGWLQEGSVSHF